VTLYEFNTLELNDQMEAVNQLGTFLDNYVTNSERCNCYAIDKFFVEVVYNAEYNTITELRSFKTGKSLDKYSFDLGNGF
jgi:outer membrane receptor for monomeric catechols